MSEAGEEHGRPDVRLGPPWPGYSHLTWNALRGATRLVCQFAFDLKTFGLRNVPRTGGGLLVSNHQSYLDPFLLSVHLPRQVDFMAKAELFEPGPMSPVIRQLNAYPVRRGEGDVGAIRETLRRVKAGRLVTIFPEGTRTEDGRIGPIQPGVAMLVRRAGVPVIPAVIDGAFEVMPRSGGIRMHPIRIMYGPALRVEGMKGEKLVELVRKTLEGMLESLRSRQSAVGSWQERMP